MASCGDGGGAYRLMDVWMDVCVCVFVWKLEPGLRRRRNVRNESVL